MTQRLVVQHARLDPAVTGEFTRAMGRPPDGSGPRAAIWHEVQPDPAMVRALAERHRVDAGLVPDAIRLADFRLIALDMDSTLITIECIDELADFAGRKAEVAAVTQASMRGELPDFETSLRQRVALLAGLDATALDRVYSERLHLSPGAETLLTAVRAAGLKILLVSGGFTQITDRLRDRLGLDHTRANTLEIADGRLTGRVIGPIVDAAMKRETVLQTCAAIGCSPQQAIVVGDGANDVPMMSVAGVSIAYRAKPVVRAQSTWALDYSGLDAIIGLLDGQPG